MIGIGVEITSLQVLQQKVLVAPAKVTTLSVVPDESPTCKLLWVAAGHSGFTGTAAQFAMRHSSSGPILTESDWNTAASSPHSIPWEANSVAGGSSTDLIANGVEVSYNYYVVRYKNSIGNMGPISNCVSIWLDIAP
jgi:hypothetical protein